MQKAYEQLKTRLEAEGLFDAAHKKPLPYLPDRIGIITSPTGAVIKDILHITARRFPSIPIVLAPVRVQGPEASDEIIQAIADMNGLGALDVIIMARGGGSFEDLYPFNTEAVARAIFASRIPIISAVGHETDVTISDFVADLRAPTPSAAAELVAPLREDLADHLISLSKRLLTLPLQRIDRRRDRLADLENRLKDPRRILEDLRLRLDYALERIQSARARHAIRCRHLQEQLAIRLQHANSLADIHKNRLMMVYLRKNMTASVKNVMGKQKEVLLSRQTALNTLNPLAVLQRGYSLTTKWPQGWVVRAAGSLAAGNDVRVRLGRGGFLARVTEVNEEE